MELKLNDVCDLITCGVAKRPEYVENGVPFLSSKNVKEDRFILKHYNHVSEEDFLRLTKYAKPENDDILYTRVGSFGEAAVININIDFAIFVSLTLIKPKKDIVYSRWLMYYLNSPKIRNLAKASTSGIGVQNLNVGTVRKFPITLPPLETQQKVAAILDEADKLRQLNKELIVKYEALTQSLFLDMFGDPVINPKGWEVKQLGNITLLVTDGKHGNCNDEKGSGYYFVSAKDIRNDKINYTNSREIPKEEFEEVDKRTNLQPGDLVMINTGATIGRMAIAQNIPETRRSTFQKSVAIIKVKKEIVSSLFLKYVFELRLDVFANKGSGSAIKNLLLSEMRKFKIILPPTELQNQFAERVALIEQQKQQAQESLQKSEDLFNSLLQKAFKGELVK